MRFDNFSGDQYDRAALRVPLLPIVAFLPQASALQTKKADWFCTAACIRTFTLRACDSHWTVRSKPNEERINFCKCSLYDIAFGRKYLYRNVNEYCSPTHSNIWEIFSRFIWLRNFLEKWNISKDVTFSSKWNVYFFKIIFPLTCSPFLKNFTFQQIRSSGGCVPAELFQPYVYIGMVSSLPVLIIAAVTTIACLGICGYFVLNALFYLRTVTNISNSHYRLQIKYMYALAIQASFNLIWENTATPKMDTS